MPDKSTTTEACASYKTFRASIGESVSIGGASVPFSFSKIPLPLYQALDQWYNPKLLCWEM
jgi:hypothetical protein